MRNLQGKFHDTFTAQGMERAKLIVDTINKFGGTARIDTTYLDYGQDWTWETILVKSKTLDLDYQALNPRDFEEINEGKLSLERQLKIVGDALKD